MSVSDWTPASSRAEVEIDLAWLRKCVTISQQEALEEMSTRLGEEDIRDKASY